MKTSDFDFNLPKELIAYRPLEKRDNSRLCVLHRDGSIEHKRFFHIADYLREGDLILLNNTKVFPARIVAERADGVKLDILFLRQIEDGEGWEVIYKGDYTGIVYLGDGYKAETKIEKNRDIKRKILRLLNMRQEEMMDLLWRYGLMPLPPYIKRSPDDQDKERYQTIYAEKVGSIAAPTAGLHFTDQLLNKLKDKGVSVEKITLHVGIGTFKPIRTVNLEDHKMDAEYFEIGRRVLEKIKDVKDSKNRVIAVGTTVTRAIEGLFSERCRLVEINGFIKGYTDIFIYPGYRFQCIDALITNFHLPRSTPLMLVSAFSGFERVMKAYKEAISMGYRFFSYGDAMLFL
jgi:S-adenosylmethionine:tRNA ribosyltransferase-isomerase